MPKSTSAPAGVSTVSVASVASPDVPSLLASWRRALQARNLAPHSITMYVTAADQLAAYLAAQGMPQSVASIRREHVESFLTSELTRCKAASVVSVYTKLRLFFAWCAEDGEISESPMARIRAPRQPHLTAPTVLTDDDLRDLLAACNGGGFADRRDLAILRTLLDTGLRVSELCALTLADVDLDTGAVVVRQGKGRKDRVVFIGAKTSAALDRYLRLRRVHPQASASDALWLAVRHHKPLHAEGVRKLLAKRAHLAGIDRHLWPHLFRHTFADRWLKNGGQESDLLTIAGWSSADMLARYGASARVARAQLAHKQFSPGDRL